MGSADREGATYSTHRICKHIIVLFKPKVKDKHKHEQTSRANGDHDRHGRRDHVNV